MFNGVKKVIQLITESDILIYSKKPDTLTQSCTRVQISRSDPTRLTKIVTRPDPMTIHNGQKRLYARHDAHCPAIAPMRPAARESAPTLRTYQIHVPSVRMHRDLHEVAALYQLLPESLNCDHWVPTNMYARNVCDVAVELSLTIRPWSSNSNNSSGDEIANVNFLTTISHTRRPNSKYRKRDKPTSFNKLDDR